MLLLGTAGVAMLIALIVARRLVRADDASGRWLLGIGIFIVLNLVGRSFVKPHVAEQKRLENPVYRAAKAHAPDLYEQLRAIDPDREVEMLLEVRKKTAAMLARYAPSASDESLREFLRLSVEQMDALRGTGLFSALFPGAGGVDLEAVGKRLTEESVKRQMAALAAIIETGATGEPKPIDRTRAISLLERVGEATYVRNIGGVESLEARGAVAESDRARTVAAVRNFYGEILALPPADSALVMRYLLSQAHGR